MSGGIAKALEEVLDGEAEAEALDVPGLFDDFDQVETGRLDAPSPLSQALPKATLRGRRPGSRNRRTEATVRWLMSQHRHPLSVMAEAYSMPTVDLAKAIGLSEEYDKDTGKSLGYGSGVLLELFKLQMRMAEAVTPYVAQKLPQAVQLEGKGGLTLSFEGVSLPARGPMAGGSGVIEGEALSVRLPFKSDDEVGPDA